MDTRDEARNVILTFRVSAAERREIQLLAKAEGASRSALLRQLVKERVAEVADR